MVVRFRTPYCVALFLLAVLSVILTTASASDPVNIEDARKSTNEELDTFSEKNRGLALVIDKSREIQPLYNDSYALLVGLSAYNNGWSSLNTVTNELGSVELALENQGFLTTRHADSKSNELKSVLDQFIGKYGHRKDSRLLIFFRAMGIPVIPVRRGTLCPSTLLSRISFLKNLMKRQYQ